MKVAIIGAGIAGLSCAFELEKNGISPVIFEKNSIVAQVPGFTGIHPNHFVRSTIDPLKHLYKQYQLKLEPLSTLKHIAMISENKRMDAKGNLGYIFKRGAEEYSLENQIAAKIKSPIYFNKYVDADQIKHEFDHVVVASGNSHISKKLNVWTDTFIARTRVATVSGDFNTNMATAWFNNDYCAKGFGFLIPYAKKEATLALVIKDVTRVDLDYYWEKFLSQEQIKHTIVHTFDNASSCGFVSSFKNDNIYLVGNAAGLLDDIIGVGSFNAIESGIFAARSIVTGQDYNKMIKPIFNSIKKLHDIKKSLDTFSNHHYDKMVSFVGTPGINQLIYNLPFVKMSHAAPIATLFNKINIK